MESKTRVFCDCEKCVANKEGECSMVYIKVSEDGGCKTKAHSLGSYIKQKKDEVEVD